MMDLEILVAPIIIFMVIVAPLWLILHYRSKKQVSQGLSEHEHRQLIELANKAEKMAERVETRTFRSVRNDLTFLEPPKFSG